MNSIRLFSALLFLSVLSPQLSKAQGSLQPPSGVPVPSMKTLDQIEPRTPLTPATTQGNATSVVRITQPGSYYLTGNLTVPAAFHGIEIAANDVTLDLGGFTITGQPGSRDGITVNTIRYRITIRCGNIQTMGDNGINLFVSNAEACSNVLAQLNISGCGKSGASLPNGLVRDCHVTGNQTGLNIMNGGGTVVEDCTASGNKLAGFNLDSATVSRCRAVKTQNGTGFAVTDGIVQDCVSMDNQTGIEAYNSTVRNCIVHRCSYAGINARYRNRLADNNVADSVIGIILAGYGNRVQGNLLTEQPLGIEAMAANNFITGNSFRACTKALKCVANNRVGVLVTGTAAAAIDGNTGGGLGTADPSANVIF